MKKLSELTYDDYETVMHGHYHPNLIQEIIGKPGVMVDGHVSIDQFASWLVMSQLTTIEFPQGSPEFDSKVEELTRNGKAMGVRLEQILTGVDATGNVTEQKVGMTQEQRELINRVLDRAKRKIWVTFQKEGLHKYPAAQQDPRLYDVQFLGYEHRHMFHFRVAIDVFHNDRDIEFIQFKRWCEALYAQSTLTLDYKSCEMIADDLYTQIAAKYPGRDVTISVAEDNENGCTIDYNLYQPQLQSV
jgi:hypothetical protein